MARKWSPAHARRHRQASRQIANAVPRSQRSLPFPPTLTRAPGVRRSDARRRAAPALSMLPSRTLPEDRFVSKCLRVASRTHPNPPRPGERQRALATCCHPLPSLPRQTGLRGSKNRPTGGRTTCRASQRGSGQAPAKRAPAGGSRNGGNEGQAKKKGALYSRPLRSCPVALWCSGQKRHRSPFNESPFNEATFQRVHFPAQKRRREKVHGSPSRCPRCHGT